MLVLLDTSFLLTMLRERIEFYEEIRSTVPGPVRIATVDLVLLELGRLARSNSFRTGGLARLALEELENKKVGVLESKFSSTDADTAILTVALSQKSPVVVATLDRQLRETLAKNGVSTIYPRRRRGLTISLAKRSVLK